MQRTRYENESEVADIIARKLGYIDYPSDSVEQGDIWYTEPTKAPFGRTISKKTFNDLLFKGHYSLKFIEQFKINIYHNEWWVDVSSDDEKLMNLCTREPAHIAVLEYLSGKDLIPSVEAENDNA